MENTDNYEYNGFPTEEPVEPETIEEVTLPEAPVDEIPAQEQERPVSPFADSPYVTYSSRNSTSQSSPKSLEARQARPSCAPF